MPIRICTNDQAIKATFAVMKQLRTQLKNPDAYLKMIKEQQASQQYSLTALFNDDDTCIAVMGHRTQKNLYTEGKPFFYVDDLVTDEKHRGQGYGKQLITYLKNLSKEKDYYGVFLDSGKQRADAHRFYKGAGFQDMAVHFYRPPSPDDTAAVDTKTSVKP